MVERVRFAALIRERDVEELDGMLQTYYGKTSNDQSENQVIGCVNYMKEVGWTDGIMEICERWRGRRKDFVVSFNFRLYE